MPPPSFSSQSSFQVHAPRGTVALLKEATQAVYAHLQKGSDGGAAWTALQALLADLHLDTDMSDPEWIHAPEPERSGACESIAERLHVDLIDMHGGADAACMLRVVEQAAILLGPGRLIAHWAHALVFPALSQSHALSYADVARAHRLCVYMMLSVPLEVYDGVQDTHAYRRDVSPASDAALAFTQSVFMLYAEGPVPGRHPALASLDTILSMYSETRPTPFLHHVALTLSPTCTHLLHALILFLQRHTMHTYRITSTCLLEELLALLVTLDDATVLEEGIKCLVMILPHVPYWLSRSEPNKLPALFRLYAHVVTVFVHANEHVRLLFSTVYGLFPGVFLWFLRAPDACLAHLGDSVPWDENDTLPLQRGSDIYLEHHLVHPQLAKHEPASDEPAGRMWQHSDPADLLAMCQRLYVPTTSIPDRDVPLPMADESGDVRLRSEWRFELYMREQLLMHIGCLHRDRIAGTAEEEQQQQLQDTNRMLRTQLQTLQAHMERQRAEVQAANARHMQWESELTTKLNTYRDERRGWMLRVQELEVELDKARSVTKSQADVISDLGARLFRADADLQLAAPKFARLQKYDAAVHRLHGSLSEWEDKLTNMDAQRDEMNKLLWRFQAMELHVVNSERSARHYSEATERLSYDKAQLDRDVQILRAQVAEQRERLQHLEALRWQQAVPPAPPAPDFDTVHALKSRNASLELELLECRSQLEKHAMDRAQGERRTHMTPALAEATLFSPNTLRTPQEPAVGDDVVPPLSLGPPAQ